MGLARYLKVLFSALMLPVLFVLRFLFSFAKRDSKFWIFGAWNGETFNDNTKYLFLYLVNNRRDITCRWITRSRKVENEMLALDLPVAYLYSLDGLRACIRAGKQLTTHSLYDVSPVLTKGSIHFCLFHATFPIKRMEFSYLKNTFKKRISIYALKPFAFEIADYSICSSESTASVVQSALGMQPEQVYQTGYPRSVFLDKKMHLKTDLARIKSICDFSAFENFIYFVPTFRDDPNFDWFNFGFNMDMLVKFLNSTNSVLIFRLHPFDQARFNEKKFKEHDRIIFESHGLSDPYPLLSRANILITDYSSIFADFLLMNRPIIFANFDHEKYIENERGLCWDYEAVTPGPKASNWISLMDILKEVIVDKSDDYKNERTIMRNMIYENPVSEVLPNVAGFVEKH